MIKPLDWQGFLHWLAFVVVASIFLVMCFILLVDPYDLYRIIQVPRLNAVKPNPTQYISEIKLAQAVRLSPDIIILGNSRAEIGIDPQFPAITSQGYSAYNLAIPGTPLETTRSQLEYLIAKGIKPKMILLGLDFLDFLGSGTPAAKHNSSPSSFSADRYFWRFDCLFSMASVLDAVRTLAIQSEREAATMTSRGFNPLLEYNAIAHGEGYYALFWQKATDYSRAYFNLSTRGPLLSNFDQLNVILDLAAKSDSQAILFIYPYHAQILALFEEFGIWPLFDPWKQRIAALLSMARLRHGKLRIDLYDFSGYGPRQCERIPAKGDLGSSTRWYWEAGHFKKALGDAVLEEVLPFAAPSAVPSDFGVKLDESKLDFNSQRVARERAECERVYPELFQETKELAMAVRSRP